MPPPPGPPTAPRRLRDRVGRALEIVLGLCAAAVFTLLWVGFAVGLATGGRILADAWAWLSGLEPLAAVVAWILLLPIAVGLWAWNAVGSPLVMGAVAVGLVAWTLVAASSAVRTFRRR
jgi:hypothetical protein